MFDNVNPTHTDNTTAAVRMTLVQFAHTLRRAAGEAGTE